MSFHMYVSVAGEDRIAVFEVEAETGRLEPRGGVAVPGRPAPLAVDPRRRYLYAGQRDEYGIISFRIDRTTGAISPIGRVGLESDPCFLSTDRTGAYLLSSYYNAGRVAVHPIGEDGVAGGPAVEWLATATGAHSIQTDPSNRFAFVPHIADRGPNLIFQFRFDESTGRLTPNSPPTVVPEADAGPRHYCFHPSKDIVYFSNEQGCSVSAYRLDTADGTLSHLQTVSTLPDGYAGSNTCSQIQVSRSGRYLYAPNRGHDSIATFAVDGSTGALTPAGWAAAEPVPRAFSLDPEGRTLFAAGLDSGRLTSYRVDGRTGELRRIETNDVGREPMWVLVTGPAE